jgi:hypothetical protein
MTVRMATPVELSQTSIVPGRTPSGSSPPLSTAVSQTVHPVQRTQANHARGSDSFRFPVPCACTAALDYGECRDCFAASEEGDVVRPNLLVLQFYPDADVASSMIRWPPSGRCRSWMRSCSSRLSPPQSPCRSHPNWTGISHASSSRTRHHAFAHGRLRVNVGN